MTIKEIEIYSAGKYLKLRPNKILGGLSDPQQSAFDIFDSAALSVNFIFHAFRKGVIEPRKPVENLSNHKHHKYQRRNKEIVLESIWH